MSTIRELPEPAAEPPVRLRFQLVHVFYAMAVLASALATFGGGGLIIGAVVLAFWVFVFSSWSPPQALRYGGLLALLGGCLLSCLLLAWVGCYDSREDSRRAQCTNNLKMLLIGLHNYHDQYSSFPPAFVWRGQEAGNCGV